MLRRMMCQWILGVFVLCSTIAGEASASDDSQKCVLSVTELGQRLHAALASHAPDELLASLNGLHSRSISDSLRHFLVRIQPRIAVEKSATPQIVKLLAMILAEHEDAALALLRTTDSEELETREIEFLRALNQPRTPLSTLVAEAVYEVTFVGDQDMPTQSGDPHEHEGNPLWLELAWAYLVWGAPTVESIEELQYDFDPFRIQNDLWSLDRMSNLSARRFLGFVLRWVLAQSKISARSERAKWQAMILKISESVAKTRASSDHVQLESNTLPGNELLERLVMALREDDQTARTSILEILSEDDISIFDYLYDSDVIPSIRGLTPFQIAHLFASDSILQLIKDLRSGKKIPQLQ